MTRRYFDDDLYRYDEDRWVASDLYILFFSSLSLRLYRAIWYRLFSWSLLAKCINAWIVTLNDSVLLEFLTIVSRQVNDWHPHARKREVKCAIWQSYGRNGWAAEFHDADVAHFFDKNSLSRLKRFHWRLLSASLLFNYSMERIRLIDSFIPSVLRGYFGVWMNNKMIERRYESDWMRLSRIDAIVAENMTKCSKRSSIKTQWRSTV